MLVFYKYRIQTGSSLGTWHYIFLENNHEAHACFEELEEQRRLDSEHFRGLDYKRIRPSRLPKAVLNEFIQKEIKIRNKANENLYYLTTFPFYNKKK